MLRQTVDTRRLDKFSWKAVGLSALTAFLGPVPVGKIAGSAFLGNVVGGALTNAAVQGIGVATGLQDKFSWAGVAAAGIGAGVGGAVGSAFKAPTSALGVLGQDLAVSTASTLANAATRSAIEGSNFGENIMAALPDAIGGAVGRALGRAGAEALSKARTAPAKQAVDTVGAEASDIIVNQDAIRAAMDRVSARQMAALLAPPEVREATARQVIARAKASAAHVSVEGEGANATSALPPLGIPKDFTYTGGGPNNGEVHKAGTPFSDDPYFYNRETGTIDYYQLPAGGTEAIRVTDPIRTRMLNDELSELNWGIGGFLGVTAGGAALAVGGVIALPSALSSGQGLLYANAFRISTLSLTATEVVTGVQVGTPVVVAGGLLAKGLTTEGVSSPSAVARAFQGKGAYPGVDRFRDITLKEGTMIYAGEPGASGFFTTSGAFRRTGNDAQAIFEGLQVSPRDGFYRPGLTQFIVTKDTQAAFSIVRQNPQFGSGGLPQIFIKNFSDVTRPVVGYPLVNTTSRLP